MHPIYPPLQWLHTPRLRLGVNTVAEDIWVHILLLGVVYPIHVLSVSIVYLYFTPSNNKEYPPFLGYLVENKHQHEIEHDSFTQHPKEHSSEQVVKENSHKRTRYLRTNIEYRNYIINYYIDSR